MHFSAAIVKHSDVGWEYGLSKNLHRLYVKYPQLNPLLKMACGVFSCFRCNMKNNSANEYGQKSLTEYSTN